MPAVTRLGDLCTGHTCWPSRPSITASPDVVVNNIPVHRLGDNWALHACPPSPPHGGVLAGGSSIVYANNLPVGRIGDPVSCGSSVATGSPDVFDGG